jgi:hypothetical protein
MKARTSLITSMERHRYHGAITILPERAAIQKTAAPPAMAEGRSYNGDGPKHAAAWIARQQTRHEVPQSSIRAVDEYDRSALALDMHHPQMGDIASHALSAGATERYLHTPALRRSRIMPNISEVLKGRRAAAAPRVITLPSRHEADRRSAVESWENEGGHFPEFAPIRNPSAAVPEPAVTESEMQRAEIESLTRELADGLRQRARRQTVQHLSTSHTGHSPTDGDMGRRAPLITPGRLLGVQGQRRIHSSPSLLSELRVAAQAARAHFARVSSNFPVALSPLIKSRLK